MLGRTTFVETLLEDLEQVVAMIEEREAVEPDLAVVRELADQLVSEIESLAE